MNWLLSVGDTDILRDAVSPMAVFWHRMRGGRTLVAGSLALTALLGFFIILAVLGPDRTGWVWAQRDWMAIAASVIFAGWAGYNGWLLFQFMPSRNDRVVLRLRELVRQGIDPLEEQIRALSDDQLRAKTAEFKQRLAAGESLDDIRPEAYACVREASRRARNHRQFECQLIGAKVLEDCNVAEMRTGEGKTIVCYAANYLKVLQGLKVHMVTVNDYLVKRDADFCRPIFDLLGVTVGYITSDMETYGAEAEVRREAYNCDITYGTNSEFGFDYLRDNMKHSARDQMQGRQDYVVVDEVDSILIDEARTPLIISGPAHDDVSNYRVADNIARMLIAKQQAANRETARRLNDLEQNPPPEARNNPKFYDGIKKFRADPLWLSSEEAEAIGHMQYFVVELDRKSAHMTEHGAKAAQAELAIGTFYDTKNMNWPHYIDNALRAHLAYQKDKEYVAVDDQIIIVDEFTGRMMHGRQWSDGLHQAVEAKEKVTIKQETQTLATITLQNLFKMYRQLAGMTGTAMTEADEFMKIYKLEVIAIPTNQPVRRIDYNDKIYKTRGSKLDALVEEIRAYSQKGYPADAYSLLDMLKMARRTLVSLRDANGNGQAPEEARVGQAASLPGLERIDEQIRIADEAIRAFGNGEGDEAALYAGLEEGYRKLMGQNVGGRPVLVGTTSVEASEELSQLLSRRYGIEHEVLNARHHAREAEIVAKAGQQHEVVRGKKKEMHGNVTIATNMAGRGTDIVLGPGVAAIGGLHVVGTERHESRRIDNQLRGRCGRQGDPGSSRFFLSMEDELLRLFMGEWMLKMLNMLGFEEGMAIDDRRISKGIERAQKKVEERNFGIRKNLLEYDEVMDFQRKSFYSMRQQVVEGRGLSEMIWRMIDESVADAIDRFYDPQYPAICAAEWVGQNLNVPIEADKLDPGDGVEELSKTVRDLAAYEVRGTIQRTFGEYVDTDVDPEEWDVRGLASWAAQFGLNLTQNQIRKAQPDELLEQLIEAAQKRIEEADLSGLEPYCDSQFAKARLVRWAQEKFGVEVPLEDLATANREDAEQIFREKMRAAYKIREIEYPVDAVLQFALHAGGQNVNEVYTRIANWVNRKYGLNWTYEHLAGKSPQQIFQELRAINEDYLTNGKLDREIDQALAKYSGDALVQWAQQRFGSAVDSQPIEAGDAASPESAARVREQLQHCAYEMLRWELTQLERHVLLSTFDSLWKDHMYSMDLLRHGIGLRGYAERDPKIEYKREGTRMFNEMMVNIRERVTDLIFKVQIAMRPDEGAGARVAAAGGGLAYSNLQTTKADATGAGFASAAADQDAAMQKQGEAAKPQTIRRETPRVGRNEPCPCGSGKKYKQCCGKAR
ncbi:MAG TPA: SEC-C metal-binding domain-containing protein [Phycisphaerae bacterium]|jgi:preprotein translocase subunit SecA|nr:SEC-C metal-binding domain-containing protein [Phycisphaerae bacterium]